MAKIAVAGASGFVGRNLIARLSKNHEVFGLGRSVPQGELTRVHWRSTDLFSMTSTFEALSEIDVAIYLVHSMMPSSLLFQGDFHDTDLLLADNFAKACQRNGVKKIIYLGGLVPEGYVSPHLQSRREVESVLQSTGIPTTVLRAGMIVGPGGSSYEILKTLVERLPVMVLPRWTQSKTQAVYIDDVVNVIEAAVADESLAGKTVDVVNGESLNYEGLLRKMAAVLGLRRRMVAVPISSTGFSKLWVQIFGNATRELVSPLIDSLLCDLPQIEPSPLIQKLIRYRSFETMVAETLKHNGSEGQSKILKRKRPQFSNKTVRSIQRLPSTLDHDCHWIAKEYMTLLPQLLPFMRVVVSEDKESVDFCFSFISKPLLSLRHIPGEFDDQRIKFFIVGGLLTQTTNTGWLEFRQVQNRKYTLAAIHEFVPSLPWPIYLATQAQLHRLVMHWFGRSLSKSLKNDSL